MQASSQTAVALGQLAMVTPQPSEEARQRQVPSLMGEGGAGLRETARESAVRARRERRRRATVAFIELSLSENCRLGGRV